ncbi:MAG: S41 family peptidase, partial [Balneolaceae bacterium]|nr:S41 family peptidase [Balneolaceae bacterium]
ELKDVDWNALYDRYRPQVTVGGNDDQLFDALSAMLGELRDGHITLYTGNRFFNYEGWYTRFPTNFDPAVIANNYLPNVVEDGLYLYGQVANTGIGYIRIKSFALPTSEYRRFPQLVESLNVAEGLIIDLRNNTGGDNLNARLIAGHFTDTEQQYGFVRYKNGPGHNDFESWTPISYKPSDSFTYPGNVALLTNRRVFSSAEDFVLAMRILPAVTVIGDTTGGGSGNPILRELPNGWSYEFSRWQQVPPDFRQYEGTGLYPDIPVWITSSDSSNGRDTILDRAIEHLTNDVN